LCIAPHGIPRGDVLPEIGACLDAQLREHVVGREHIALFHVGGENRCRVSRVADIEADALCHDALGNVVEHHAAHAATRSGQSRLLDAYDAAVSRGLGGEIAGKREQVIGASALISRRSLRDLGRTGLARHGKRLRPGFLAQAFAHHLSKHLLHELDHLGRGNLLMAFDHRGGIFLDDLAIFYGRLDKPGLHHLAAVGDGVIEGQSGDGRYLCLVTDAHPRQCGVAPVHPFAAFVLLGHAHPCRRRSHDGDVQVGGDTRAIDSLHEFLRVFVVILVHDAAHADVRAYLQGLGHVHHAVAAVAPVVVFHLPAIHRPDATAGVDHLVGVAHAILEDGHHGYGLEHRAGLEQVAHGMVLDLPIFAVDTFLHVDDGLDVARLHLHDDGHTHIAVDFLQLVDDRTLGQVLYAHVDGSHDVGARHGRGVHDVKKLVEHLASMLDAGGAPQQRVVRQLEPAARRTPVVHGGIHVAHGSSGQCAVGPFARVQLILVKAALEFRQSEDGQLLHLRVGVIVDSLGPDGPVALHLATALFEMSLEGGGALFGEYLVKSLADTV